MKENGVVVIKEVKYKIDGDLVMGEIKSHWINGPQYFFPNTELMYKKMKSSMDDKDLDNYINELIAVRDFLSSKYVADSLSEDGKGEDRRFHLDYKEV